MFFQIYIIQSKNVNFHLSDGIVNTFKVHRKDYVTTKNEIIEMSIQFQGVIIEKYLLFRKRS